MDLKHAANEHSMRRRAMGKGFGSGAAGLRSGKRWKRSLQLGERCGRAVGRRNRFEIK